MLITAIALLGAVLSGCANRPSRPPQSPASPAASATGSPGGSPTAGTATPTLTPPATPPREPGASPTPESRPAGQPAGMPPRTASPAPGAGTPVATAQPAFEVQLEPRSVPQGETVLVRAVGVTNGTLRAGSQTIPMQPAPAGAWAVVGVGLYASLGPTNISVTGRDASGNALGEVPARYTVVDPQRPADYLVTTEETAAILTPEAGATETRLRAEQFASFDPAPHWRTAFRHPVVGFEVSTQFGSGRSINGGPVGDFHSGEDLAVDEGTPVMAAAPGRVAWVGAMPIRGNSVIVDHGGGVKTGYHHLLDTNVVAGQAVEAGAVLGRVGSTGFSTGPHLHWELTIFGVNVDPETWTTRTFR